MAYRDRYAKMARTTDGIHANDTCHLFVLHAVLRIMPSMCAIYWGTGCRFILDLVNWCINKKYKHVCPFCTFYGESRLGTQIGNFKGKAFCAKDYT